VLQARLLSPGIRHEARPVGDPQLLSYEIDRHDGHPAEIDHKRAELADYAKLKRAPQPILDPTAPANEQPVSIVQEEEPLELRPRRRAREPTVRGCLLIREELNRHRAAP